MGAASTPQQDGAFGQQQLASGNTELNKLIFVIQQLIGRLNVATLVQVKAVTSGGRTGAVGFVDVQPLVNQIDGSGTPMPHGVIYNVPFFRLQGGTNAVICDPVVGDIGICLFADRDISSVKSTGKQANPGSNRRFDMADGIYFGGWGHTQVPSKYVLVDANGCEISGNTSILGTLTGNSTADFTGAVNSADSYKVGGTKVVGAQQSHINAPSGGATIDANARVTIGQILTLLANHGLMA